uniref:PQ-loop domain-containing transporter n=1 Tax=Gelidibacter gilvus TaxID=59602 RepID=UPI001CB8A020
MLSACFSLKYIPQLYQNRRNRNTNRINCHNTYKEIFERFPHQVSPKYFEL